LALLGLVIGSKRIEWYGAEPQQPALPADCELWLETDIGEALKLQRPLPDYSQQNGSKRRERG
jgi:hypothetical protein